MEMDGIGRWALAASGIVAIAQPASAREPMRAFNIGPQPLLTALNEFGRQSGRDIMFSNEVVGTRRTQGVRGKYAPEEALRRLLQGSNLQFRATRDGTYLVEPAGSMQVGAADEALPNAEEGRGYSEILVTGRRTMNADVRRSEDDTQPYVVFSGKEIQRSGVTNLEDFLRTRLPMNTQRGGLNQNFPSTANTGGVTLRGLSAEQTLILVDGRRVPNVGISGAIGVGQPNINGISPLAIERIEVLPATAGGIYGGGAVGGVINIILRRDYSGLDLQGIYGNVFDGDAGYQSLGLSGGFLLEHGRTSVTLSVNVSRQNQLQFSERDFQRRSREMNLANRPADFSFPLSSYTPNICATTGTSISCPATAPNLVLDNGTPLNSRITNVPDGYAGPSADGGAALVPGAGRFNFDPATNFGTLYSAPDLQSYALAARRHFGDRVEGFVDLGFDRTETTDTFANVATVNLAANDPANPFQQNIAVSVVLPDSLRNTKRKVENLRVSGGLIARLPGDWTTSLEHNWSRNINSVVYRGLVDLSSANAYLRSIALRDPNTFVADPLAGGAGRIVQETGPFKTVLNDTILRFSGPALRLPGGKMTLSGYVEQRKEDVAANISAYLSPTSSSFTWYAPKSQQVRSAYLEARLPLIASSSGVPLVHQFELFGAIRHDEYRTVSGPQGSGVAIPSRAAAAQQTYTKSLSKVASTDYTVGLSYAPIADLTARASYGTSFLPPNLGQITTLTSPNSTLLQFFNDPKRGNTALGSSVTMLSGGDPTLVPEQSKSLSAGLILKPRFLAGLRLSADFTRIDKTREISSIPGSVNGLLQRESQFPERVVRAPLTQADQVLGYTAGKITLIDLTQLNIAKTHLEAWDFQLDYDAKTKHFGNFHSYLVATREARIVRQLFSVDPKVNTVGFADGPLRWRGNMGLDWSMAGWMFGWNVQYYHGYRICGASDTAAVCAPKAERQGSPRVPSQIYHDFYIGYQFGAGWGPALAESEIRLGIQNLFNEDPPILASTTAAGYDSYGDPRLRRFMLSIRRHLGR